MTNFSLKGLKDSMSKGKPKKKIYKDKIMLIAEKQSKDAKSLYNKARDIKTDGRLSMDDLDKVKMRKYGGKMKKNK